MVTRYSIRPDELVNSLPSVWHDDAQPNIQNLLQQSGSKLVVLHDSPNNTQAVPGTTLTLERNTAAFLREFKRDAPVFHVLMNSHDLNYRDNNALHRYVANALLDASDMAQQPFTIISQGDGTLRGHFPDDVQTLANVMGGVDGVLFMPAAPNSITLEGIHHIKQGDEYVLAGTSDLRGWLQEKSAGHINAGNIQHIDIETIRYGGVEAVYERLLNLHHGGYCVIDCVDRQDANVVAWAAHLAQQHGKQFIYRTGSYLTQSITGSVQQPPLTQYDMALGTGVGGLVVVGSGTASATQQLMALLASGEATGIEVRVESLLHDESQAAEIARCADILGNALQRNNVVLYTSRRSIGIDDPVHAQIITQRINAGLSAIINGITVCPRYIVVKGSLTATEIAGRALNVRRAELAGEFAPNVPVWTIGNGGTSLPKMSYLIVPGELGEMNLLTEIVSRLH